MVGEEDIVTFLVFDPFVGSIPTMVKPLNISKYLVVPLNTSTGLAVSLID